MYKISKEVVSKWVDIIRGSSYLVPKYMTLTCPFCNSTASMVCDHWNLGYDRRTMTFVAECPLCESVIDFWIPEFKASELDQIGDLEPKEIFIYQKAAVHREEMEGIEFIPKAVKSSYIETLDVYRIGKWIATSSMSRRTLEGIIYKIMGEDYERKLLFNLLKELPEKVNLTEKITELADEIRKAGNLASHYDEERVPNEEVSTMVLDYIEYLLEFVFVLPNKVEELSKRIELMSEKEDED